MILIVTNGQDRHVPLVTGHFRQKGMRYFQLNIEDFPSHVQLSINAEGGNITGCFKFECETVLFSEITSVWYRKPLSPVASANIQSAKTRAFIEHESSAILRMVWNALNVFWVNHPLAIQRANSRLLQWRLAAQLGFMTPKTVITNNPDVASAFLSSVPGPTVVKVIDQTIADTDQGKRSMYTKLVDQAVVNEIDRVALSPCIFQEYIEKDVELRATVVGSRVFVCEIHSQETERTRVDWRRYDFRHTPHVVGTLPEDVEERCRQLVRNLGLAFGAIDLIRTKEGRYVFLEINANGQWGWIESLTGLPIGAAIADLLIAAHN